MLGLGGLIGLGRDVRRIASLANLTIARFARVALVETEMLRRFSRGLRTFNRDRIQGLGHQLLVRHIGAGDGNRQRHPTAID